MAKKKKKQKPTHISITIELPDDDEPLPSAADTFIYHFLKTLTYWLFGFIALAAIGSCSTLLL